MFVTNTSISIYFVYKYEFVFNSVYEYEYFPLYTSISKSIFFVSEYENCYYYTSTNFLLSLRVRVFFSGYEYKYFRLYTSTSRFCFLLVRVLFSDYEYKYFRLYTSTCRYFLTCTRSFVKIRVRVFAVLYEYEYFFSLNEYEYIFTSNMYEKTEWPNCTVLSSLKQMRTWMLICNLTGDLTILAQVIRIRIEPDVVSLRARYFLTSGRPVFTLKSYQLGRRMLKQAHLRAHSKMILDGNFNQQYRVKAK